MTHENQESIKTPAKPTTRDVSQLLRQVDDADVIIKILGNTFDGICFGVELPRTKNPKYVASRTVCDGLVGLLKEHRAELLAELKTKSSELE